MAKRRTRDQKRRATERRLEQQTHQTVQLEAQAIQQQSLESPTALPASQPSQDLAQVLARAGKSYTEKNVASASLQQFFGFDPRLIYRDLTKTVVISMVILLLLVVFSRLSF